MVHLTFRFDAWSPEPFEFWTPLPQYLLQRVCISCLLGHIRACLLDNLVHIQDLGFPWETVGTPKIWLDLEEQGKGSPGAAPRETTPTKPPEIRMKDPKQSTWALSPGRCAMQLSLWPVSRRWEMSSTEHLSLCVPHPGVLLSENRPQCTPASVQQSRYLYQRCWSKYLTSPLRAGPPIYISPEHPPRTEHRLSTLRIFAE